MAEEGKRVRSRKHLGAVNQCENLDLNPSNEWQPMKMVKHEGRDVGRTRKSDNQSSSSI